MARVSVNGREFDFTAPAVTFYDAVWMAAGSVRHPENYTVAYCRSNMGGLLAPGETIEPRDGLVMLAFIQNPQWTSSPVHSES